MNYCCCEGQTAMDGRHYCAMTLRHLLPGRGVAAQAQLPRQRGLHKRALNSCGIPFVSWHTTAAAPMQSTASSLQSSQKPRGVSREDEGHHQQRNR